MVFQIFIVSNRLFLKRENRTRVIDKSFALHLIYNTSTNSIFITKCVRIFYLVLSLQSVKKAGRFSCLILFTSEYPSNPSIPHNRYSTIVPKPCNIAGNIMISTFSLISKEITNIIILIKLCRIIVIISIPIQKSFFCNFISPF